MVVHYHRQPPVIMADEKTPRIPFEVDAALLTAAAWLGSRADFLVIPANAPHLFAPAIEKASGKPLLSLIDVTLAEVARLGWKKVGVLGFGDAKVPVYTERLRTLGIEFEIVDAALQQSLNAAVIALQEGRLGSGADAAQRATDFLNARGVDGIIPGCTEIPLMLGGVSGNMVNPAELLAEAAVRNAME